MKIRSIILLAALSAALRPVSGQSVTDSVSTQVNMERITVSADNRTMHEADKNGNYSLNMDALHAMPHFAGAADVMKILQFTPGITASTDGDAGVYVRGGDAGGNRTLLGGAPVYSPAHLFGFFSVFNTPHIGGLTLLKSNIPASYGSALSSVTDIRPHGTVPERLTAEGNIGIIESDAALQIPAGKKTGIYLSARHSYTSWLLAIINNDNTSLNYEFGDYGITIVHDAGHAGRLVVNSHFNHDRAKMHLGQYDSDGKLRWHNSVTSAALRTRLRKNIEMENTAYASLYSNTLSINMTGNHVHSPSSLHDFGVRSITTLQAPRIKVQTGAEWALRRVEPQKLTTSLVPSNRETVTRNTHEAAIFISAEYSPARLLDIDAGVRLSMHAYGKDIFAYPEPRVMLSLPLTANSRLWCSYNFSVQYLHLVPQSNVSFATDFYVGSTRKNPPGRSHNFDLGYRHSFLGGALSLSAEAFYRRMTGVIEYDTRISTMLGSNYDTDEFLYSGDGESYGAEAMLSYSLGRFNIQASYTLSRSLRRFDEINGGMPFAAKSDRRHNLSLVCVWEPSRRWTLSATFLYATGGAYTAPTAIYMNGGSILKEYGPYNGSRLPDFNRLDLSATWWIVRRGAKRNGINISLYNVYARKNPLTVSWAVFRDHADPSIFKITQRRHTLYTIVPSISWTFRF